MTSPPGTGLLHRLAMRAGAQADLGDDILAQACLVLHARAGSSRLSPLDGLPDLTAHTHDLPASLPVLQRDVIATLLRGEPRIARLSPIAPARLWRGSVTLRLRAELVDGDPLSLALVLERPFRWHVARLSAGDTKDVAPCF